MMASSRTGSKKTVQLICSVNKAQWKFQDCLLRVCCVCGTNSRKLKQQKEVAIQTMCKWLSNPLIIGMLGALTLNSKLALATALSCIIQQLSLLASAMTVLFQQYNTSSRYEAAPVSISWYVLICQ